MGKKKLSLESIKSFKRFVLSTQRMKRLSLGRTGSAAGKSWNAGSEVSGGLITEMNRNLTALVLIKEKRLKRQRKKNMVKKKSMAKSRHLMRKEMNNNSERKNDFLDDRLVSFITLLNART